MSAALIAHISRYVPLSEEDALAIGKRTSTTTVEKKEYLLKEGQVCRYSYFVEKGCLRMFFITDKGTEQITQFALEGWWMADNMSLLQQAPSGFCIQAIEPAEVVYIDQAQQERLIKEVPQTERYFRIMMQYAFAAAQQRVRFFHDLSKEESYRHFADRFPGFVQRIPQYMLASYLGITPEYLSEIRKKIR
ncbi:Crp/Fnr family transcriptional regulator [Nemorincola caseinilytica]|uniref:Crp/Fnr family transcriptional regulator n=1 Tax=Nemorincola caseinilytica TaxID=2054315 RepID=A0ABP8NLT4_9BACT